MALRSVSSITGMATLANTHRHSLEKTPFQFAEGAPLGRAVTYVNQRNLDGHRTSFADAPVDFLPRRWVKHVVRKDAKGEMGLSRPHYEPALLTTLNERSNPAT